MVTFTDEALDDLENIRSRIALDRPETAKRKINEIKAKCQLLDRIPHMGRPGRKTGTRELSVNPWIVVYVVIKGSEIADNYFVEIIKIWHSSQGREI